MLTVDYFDSFKMKNRYNEPCKLLHERADGLVEVEVNYPIKKRIIVPLNCLKDHREDGTVMQEFNLRRQ